MRAAVTVTLTEVVTADPSRKMLGVPTVGTEIGRIATAEETKGARTCGKVTQLGRGIETTEISTGHVMEIVT